MACSPVPDMCRASIYDLKPDQLAAGGIRLVLADLDNTLAPYRVTEPSPSLREWKGELEEAGITLFVVSNSRRPTRVKEFCLHLGVDYVGHAGKPGGKGFAQALARTGRSPREALMVGDQIFTDTLGGNRAGVTTVLVRPIALNTVFRKLRYALETPFRLLCRDRSGGFAPRTKGRANGEKEER